MASTSARISSERPFYAAHAEAYDLLVTDPVGPWVAFVSAHLVDLVDFDLGARFAGVCRGVLNDLVDDDEGQGCPTSFSASLLDDGLVILDLREHNGSRARADGGVRETTVELSEHEQLTFQSSTTRHEGLMRVHEVYRLQSDAGSQVRKYDFTMRPWTIDGARARLKAAGFTSIAIDDGVGRRASDRFIATASRG